MTGPQLGFEPCSTQNKPVRTAVNMVVKLLAAEFLVCFPCFPKMSTLALGPTWPLFHGVLGVL